MRSLARARVAPRVTLGIFVPSGTRLWGRDRERALGDKKPLPALRQWYSGKNIPGD